MHTLGPGRTPEATARPAGQEPRMRFGGPAVTTAAGLGALTHTCRPPGPSATTTGRLSLGSPAMDEETKAQRC